MQRPNFSFKLFYQWKKDLASKSQIILSGNYSVKSGRSTHSELSENAHVPPHCLQHTSKCIYLFCDRAPELQKNSSSNSSNFGDHKAHWHWCHTWALIGLVIKRQHLSQPSASPGEIFLSSGKWKARLWKPRHRQGTTWRLHLKNQIHSWVFEPIHSWVFEPIHRFNKQQKYSPFYKLKRWKIRQDDWSFFRSLSSD